MVRLAASSLIVLAVLFSPALAKDEEEPSTPNEQAIAFAKDFKGKLKKMGEPDILEAIDKLVAFYNQKEVDDKKAKKAILDAMAKAAGVRNSLVVAKVMQKCGEMDDGVLKILLGVLGRELKKKEPNDDIYESALESLGKLRSENPTAIKTLTDLLKYKKDEVVARAARAIASYEKASGKVRKGLFEEVLKQSEGVYSSAQGNNQPMERKWNIIGDDVMEALHKLSQPPRPNNVKFNNPAPARQWFNKNKKQPWDAKKKK
ncbi:MAG: hypothetical protein ACYTDY_19135 [Planctomycetota bacterium]|jgi:hypothetical protein